MKQLVAGAGPFPCSPAVDFRSAQTVNGEKGVHGMLRKGLLF